MGLLGTIQVPPLKRLAIHAKVIAPSGRMGLHTDSAMADSGATFYFTLPSVRPLAPGQ